jgi:hypothetical protein
MAFAGTLIDSFKRLPRKAAVEDAITDALTAAIESVPGVKVIRPNA